MFRGEYVAGAMNGEQRILTTSSASVLYTTAQPPGSARRQGLWLRYNSSHKQSLYRHSPSPFSVATRPVALSACSLNAYHLQIFHDRCRYKPIHFTHTPGTQQPPEYPSSTLAPEAVR